MGCGSGACSRSAPSCSSLSHPFAPVAPRPGSQGGGPGEGLSPCFICFRGGTPRAAGLRILTTVQREAFSSPLLQATCGGPLKLLCPTTLGLGACSFFLPSDHAQILDFKGTPRPHSPRKLNFLEPGCPVAWCLENRPPRPRTLWVESWGMFPKKFPCFLALLSSVGQARVHFP